MVILIETSLATNGRGFVVSALGAGHFATAGYLAAPNGAV
jgi:hypothetical protein